MIAIINACGANFASVEYALARLGKKSVLTADPEIIQTASHVILPGVGTASQAMQQLQQLNLIPLLRQLTQPVLGICLGMQILHEYSEEGEVDCLGIIPGQVKSLSQQIALTVPHMGWNRLQIRDNTSPLLKGIPEGSYFYYVHSYAVSASENTIGITQYGVDFSAAVQYKNYYGVQFHPERSSGMGAKILENFVSLNLKT